jgi:acyl-CoA thioester hydrolase
MRRPYFPSGKDDPPPLRVTVERQVRFEETDPLGIVWHGRYASYFEDARSAAGEKYGVGYLDMVRNGVIAPIRILHSDYHRPLRYHDNFTVEGVLHWTEAARIDIEYIIRDKEGLPATTGYTVQIMLDMDGNLLLIPPPFYREFCEKWRAGQFH